MADTNLRSSTRGNAACSSQAASTKVSSGYPRGSEPAYRVKVRSAQSRRRYISIRSMLSWCSGSTAVSKTADGRSIRPRSADRNARRLILRGTAALAE